MEEFTVAQAMTGLPKENIFKCGLTHRAVGFICFLFSTSLSSVLYNFPALMLGTGWSVLISPSLCFMHSALSYNLETKEVLGWLLVAVLFPSLVRHEQAQK